jgi:hypothetical protein
MVLFAILLIMLVVLGIFMTLVVGTTGAVGIIVFADVIVCMALIMGIIKWLVNRKKKD